MLVTKDSKKVQVLLSLDSKRIQSIKKSHYVYIMKTFVVELGNRKIHFSAGMRFTINNSGENLSFTC